MTTRQIAHGIAQLGRHGDSTLVHMQPHEVAGLQALAKANGTSMTINPHTGLPEAFSLGGFFSSLLPTIAGFGAAGLSGGAMSPMMAGILAGSATGALTNKKNPLMGAVMGGLGGYGGSELFKAAGAFMPQAAAQSGTTMEQAMLDPTIRQQIQNQSVAMMEPWNAGIGPNMGATNITPYNGAVDAAGNTVGANMNFVQPIGATAQTAQTAFDTGSNLLSGTGVGGITGGQTIDALAQSAAPTSTDQLTTAINNVAQNPLDFAMANKMKVGMPLGMAALSGLEPSDIYGETVAPGANPKDKYDPYATLNLNTNTGLRLYAAGGPVSFADGGDSNKELSLDPAGLPGSGAAALQGADQVEVTPGGTKLGIFATADQIDAARKADELAKASQGRGLPGLGIMTGLDRGGYQGMGGFNRMYGGMGGMGSTAPTMATLAARNVAPTAQTAAPKYNYLEQLNLNKQYATGGTIQSGGMQDLYNTNDDTTAGVALSRDGYGLGRLNAMAQGGVPSYAEGGVTGGEALNLDRQPSLNVDSGIPYLASGVPDMQYIMKRGYQETGNPIMRLFSMVPSDKWDVQKHAKGGYLDGPGDGMSDSIPATIEGRQPARLADGEFVVPADVVSHLGNGSTKAGSERLYGMLDKVRKARTGTTKQGKKINPAKYMPA